MADKELTLQEIHEATLVVLEKFLEIVEKENIIVMMF